MFTGRNVTAANFQAGEKVWVVFEGRVREASVAAIQSVPTSDETIRVQFAGVTERAWVSPQDVFKRPTEYHILKAAIDGLIEDLQRDCQYLLVAS